MKVLAVNGSARKGGNTALLVEEVFVPLREAGVDCELVELAGSDIRGCTGCGRCSKERDGICYGRTDDGNAVISAALEADGLILASPVYFADVTPELKAVIDRLGMVARAHGGLVRKPGAGVVAVRRAGAMHALDSINHFFGIEQMYVVSSTYWNVGIGRERGGVLEDEEGMRTMRRLGENFAFLLDRLS